MWERGLKLYIPLLGIYLNSVAPHVGAWIETPITDSAGNPVNVAPHVGAWIETA